MVDKEESHAQSELPGAAGSVEALFACAKFGRSQIDQQQLGTLRESLAHIEEAIANPLGWVAKIHPPGAPDLTDPVLRALLDERKRLILRRIDLLVNTSKIHKIRELVSRIPDRRTRAAIFKELNELLAKDEIIEAEYRRMDADRQVAAAGQAPVGEDPAAAAEPLAPGPSAVGGFVTVPAGALLLASAAICLITVFSTRLSVLEVAVAAFLVLGGLGLLGRQWVAQRGGRQE
jgi:hypothetical protein